MSFLQPTEYESVVCSWSQEGQQNPGLYQKQCDQQDQGIDFIPVSGHSSRSHLKYCAQFWVTNYNKLLEHVQKMAMSLVRGLECKSYKEQLRKLWLFNLEKRLSEELITPYNLQKRDCSEVGAGLFSQIKSDRRRLNSLKLHQGRYRLDIRKKIFTKRVILALEHAC